MHNTTGYEVFMLIDDKERKSLHYAKSKEESIQAHVTHWGLQDGLYENQTKIFPMIPSRTDVVCMDPTCLRSVGMTSNVLNQILEQQNPQV